MMSRGIIAIGIDKEDELVGAALTDGNQIIFLASHEGRRSASTKTTCAPWAARLIGVRGMDLDKGDYIVGMAATPKDARRPRPHPRRPSEAERRSDRDRRNIPSKAR